MPAVRWTEGFDLSSFLQLINQVTHIDSEGRLAFTTWRFQSLIALLNSMLSFSPEPATLDKQTLIFDALTQVRRQGPVTQKALLGSLSRHLNAFQKRPRS